MTLFSNKTFSNVNQQIPIELFLPWPPSGNNPRRVNTSKRAKTLGRVDFRELVIRMTDILFHKKGYLPFDKPVKVIFITHPPRKYKHDLDNLLKLTIDSLVLARVIVDDFLIDHLTIMRGDIDPDKYGYLEVQITLIETNQGVE